MIYNGVIGAICRVGRYIAGPRALLLDSDLDVPNMQEYYTCERTALPFASIASQSGIIHDAVHSLHPFFILQLFTAPFSASYRLLLLHDTNAHQWLILMLVLGIFFQCSRCLGCAG